jgi:hypothetical protein
MSAEVETVAGVRISISPNTPTTFNAAGYGALAGFVEIGEITDGGEHGREYALVTHMPIATRGTQKFKGSFNEGSKTLQLADVAENAGQIVAKAALNSDNDYSFKVVYQGGDVDYFRAKVMSFKKATAGVDSIRSATMVVEITTNSAGVGIVEVPNVSSP